MRGRSGGSERGSATIELAVVAPALGALIALAVLAGHVGEAHQLVAQAAEDAARAASLTRSQGGAQTAALQAATADLSGHLSCRTPAVTLSGVLAPGSTVTVAVSCTTGLGLWPGSLTMTATAGSVVDTYRGTA